jgi:hypothetical protein
MSPAFQTESSLEFDTPQFSLILPGKWDEETPTENNVVYCGRSGARWVSISIFLFTKPLTVEERRSALQGVLSARRSVEQRLSNGAADVESTPIFDDEGISECCVLTAYPEMGLVSMTRLIADEEKILSVYWQADGFDAPPNLRELHAEFQQITDTIQLK